MITKLNLPQINYHLFSQHLFIYIYRDRIVLLNSGNIGSAAQAEMTSTKLRLVMS